MKAEAFVDMDKIYKLLDSIGNYFDIGNFPTVTLIKIVAFCLIVFLFNFNFNLST